jgi:dTDP-4-dehydrorhamnose 3,5-epimerase
MKFTPAPLNGLVIIEPKVFPDDRGFFFESYNKNVFAQNEISTEYVQDNQSISKKGVLRGLHFQLAPHEQGKLVSVVRGAVIDVAVDIRKSSATFGKHFAIELNDQNRLLLWIPAGFAHGFVTLEDNTIFTYKCNNFYNKQSESGIRFDDADLKINWIEKNPILSDKDLQLMSWKEFSGLG